MVINAVNNPWNHPSSLLEKTYLSLSDQAEIITGPLQISFDITNKCMMKCMHCFNRSSSLKRKEMDDERVVQVINQIIKVKPQQICFCGGEPLMRRQLVMEGAKKLRDAGIIVGMVTNGYLLDRKIAMDAEKAGFSQIQVSLDGFRDSHDRLRGLRGAFDRAVDALKNLRDAGIATLTSFAPTRFNIEEFQSYIEFVQSIGVQEVRVQPLMLLGEAFLNVRIFPTDEQYCQLSRLIKLYNYKYSDSMIRKISDTNDARIDYTGPPSILWGDPIDHIIRFSKELTKPTFSYQISSTGKISPSPYLPITVGDACRHPLSDYWDAGLNRIWEFALV
ncbi:MAG: radical SAM protein, partial [Syntrophales bacterium]|nr:radical SAM protein [Syntrophales bacterium]